MAPLGVSTLCDHTEDHAIDSELLAMSSIVFEEEHVARAAQNEQQQEDGVDWDIGYDRRDLPQGL
jgi:hypothetical protein